MRSDYLNKEDVLRSAKQQLDLHISILRDELGVSRQIIEIELHSHMKKVLKDEE